MLVELLLGLLPFLVFLACPLMMVFCMFGMRKSDCSSSAAPATTNLAASVHGLARPEQISALQAHLGRLQSEQALIAQQIDELAVQEWAAIAPNDYKVNAVPAAVQA